MNLKINVSRSPMSVIEYLQHLFCQFILQMSVIRWMLQFFFATPNPGETQSWPWSHAVKSCIWLIFTDSLQLPSSSSRTGQWIPCKCLSLFRSDIFFIALSISLMSLKVAFVQNKSDEFITFLLHRLKILQQYWVNLLLQHAFSHC